MALPPNPVAVPVVSYEYLFCLPSSEQLWPLCSTEGLGATIRVLYPGYRGSSVTAQKSGFDRFPPVTHGWGTNQPIPDKVPPLLSEEEWPPT
jgi:hypothetical protein